MPQRPRFSLAAKMWKMARERPAEPAILTGTRCECAFSALRIVETWFNPAIQPALPADFLERLLRLILGLLLLS
jgi:hypothetical protein